MVIVWIRKERKNRHDDIEEMVKERKKSTSDLTKDVVEAKKIYDEEKKVENKEESLGKTQILEITRQMKFNFDEIKQENNERKKKGISVLNIIGEINLLCIGYYIYLLVFTNYVEDKRNYTISGLFIILLVLLFGLSVVTGKKASKVFNVLNIILIVIFIAFNAYSFIS